MKAVARNVAMQNRMAVNLILASQQGVCKTIGMEYCTCMSDSSGPGMISDTEQSVQELHDTHDWKFFWWTVSMDWNMGSIPFEGTVVDCGIYCADCNFHCFDCLYLKVLLFQTNFD